MLKASELKYPTTNVAGLEVYVIPPEEKYNVLKAAYLGKPVPRATDILEDIHTGREFMVKDLLVVKNGNLSRSSVRMNFRMTERSSLSMSADSITSQPS